MSYLNIKECIIKPHQRYEAIPNYPRLGIIFHHSSYLRLLEENIARENKSFSLQKHEKWEIPSRRLITYKGIPIVAVDAMESPIRTQTAIAENSFFGTKYFINMGAAGGVDHGIRVGDIVIGEHAVRDCGSTHFFATDDVVAESDPQITSALLQTVSNPYKSSDMDASVLKKIKGDVWSVPSMYYPWERLEQLQQTEYDIRAVEMEMAAACIFSGWLNKNYYDKESAGKIEDFEPWKEPIRVGNIFYASDILPSRGGEAWIDTLNWCDKNGRKLENGEKIVNDRTRERMVGNKFTKLKTQLLLWSISTLCDMNAAENNSGTSY